MDQLTQTAVAEIAKLAAQTNAAIVQVSAPADAKGIPSTVPALLDPASGRLAEVSAIFVLTWYSLGILLAAGIGALLGPRLLRW